ncbi:hypothetical protein BGX24_004211 [Mortierella sp. AD032]|nr:hypothetical protein BGX24_004211 [Mortierella sp. AD032]
MDPSELISLKQQVADLDSALVSDPNNDDLLTLKTELLDLISLTETLLQQEQQLTDPVGPIPVEVPSPVTAAATAGRASTSSSPYRTSVESGSGASTPTTHYPTSTTTTTAAAAPTSSASSKQPIYQPASAPRTWAVGDRCRAMFAEDGKYYEATVLGVGTGATGGQVYSLQYTGYADAPPVNLSADYLKPIYEKKHHHPSAAAASPVDGEGAGGFKAGQKRGLDSASEAVPGSGAASGGGLKKKKKDAGPNEQVQKQMAWQSFAKGGGKKGTKTGGTGIKKSIFATPDNPEGKVGVVGSGKGMTQFQQRGKHLYGNSPDSL